MAGGNGSRDSGDRDAQHRACLTPGSLAPLCGPPAGACGFPSGGRAGSPRAVETNPFLMTRLVPETAWQLLGAQVPTAVQTECAGIAGLRTSREGTSGWREALVVAPWQTEEQGCGYLGEGRILSLGSLMTPKGSPLLCAADA